MEKKNDINEFFADLNEEIEVLTGKVYVQYSPQDIIKLFLKNKQQLLQAFKKALQLVNNVYTLITWWYETNDDDIRRLLAQRLEELVAKGVPLTAKRIIQLHDIFTYKQ
ncbi:MAG: hypothetical protein V1765_00645 [bacterium]